METCRTCARCDFGNDANWLDLFHPVRLEVDMRNIRKELEIWKLQIRPNDGLPQKICTDCFTKFCTVYTLRRECQDAQITLKNLFESIDSQGTMDSDDEPNTNINNQVTIDNVIKLYAAIPEENKIDNNSNSPNLDVCNPDSTDNLIEYCVDEATKSFDYRIDDGNTCLEELSILPNNFETIQNQDNCSITTITAVDHFTNATCQAIPMASSENIVIITLPQSSDNITNINNTTITTDVQIGQICLDENKIAYECKYCYRTKDKPTEKYDSEQAVLDHIELSHDKNNPFDCPHCDEKFQDAPSRTVHLKDQHVNKQYECDVCGKKYADRFNLRDHVEKYHSKASYDCSSCDKKCPTRKSLKYHMRWHSPGRQLKCSHCDRMFISLRQMKIHEETHTDKRLTEHCTYCGQSFLHIKTLRWHIYRKHGGDKPFKCAVCTEVFASYKEKRLHMLELHATNLTARQKSECMVCQRKCKNEVELKEHMCQEHDENAIDVIDQKRVLQTKKPKQFTGVFKCDKCPQRYNLQSALDRHSAVHSIERPHACTQCKKRFKRVQDLRWHMKTHSEEKPNICDICGKSFALKYVLTQHRKSHEAIEKSFQCTTCGRTYLFEKSLRLHERVHTGKTYYKCDLCGDKFVTHIKFLCHMRKLHVSDNNKDQTNIDDLIEEALSE